MSPPRRSGGARVLSDSDTDDTPYGQKPWHSTPETRRLSAIAYKPTSDFEDDLGDGDEGCRAKLADDFAEGKDSESDEENGAVDGSEEGAKGKGKDGGEMDGDASGESEAEDDGVVWKDGKKQRFYSKPAERNRVIGWMGEENMAAMSQRGPAFQKACVSIARRIRDFVPTAADNKADIALHGGSWRPKKAQCASSTFVVNLRRKLPKMKNDVIYGRVNGKDRQIMKRTSVKEGPDSAYATDVIVADFYATKKVGMHSSNAPADDTKMKAKTERLSAKNALSMRNKAYAALKKAQKEEKEAKAAKRAERADKMLASVEKLAAGNTEVARNAERMATTQEALAATQMRLYEAQIAKMSK